MDHRACPLRLDVARRRRGGRPRRGRRRVGRALPRHPRPPRGPQGSRACTAACSSPTGGPSAPPIPAAPCRAHAASWSEPAATRRRRPHPGRHHQRPGRAPTRPRTTTARSAPAWARSPTCSPRRATPPAPWWTTTAWWTARPPTAPVWAGTARARTCCCPGRGAGSCSARSSPTPTSRPPRSRWPTGADRARAASTAAPPAPSWPPGVVDARRCLAWLVQAPGVFPVEHRVALGDRIYGCDTCQEVCPPNRRSRRAGSPAARRRRARRWPCSTCCAPPTRSCWPATAAGTSPGATPTTCAATRSWCWATSATAATRTWWRCSSRYLRHPNPLLRAHAVWAARRLGRDDLLAVRCADDRGSPEVTAPRLRPMKHLLVTNDFPPKLGGIQTYLWELWRRLPPDETTVLTTPHEGAEAWDRAQPFRVVRSRQPVLLPTPAVRAQIDALADEVGAELVILDPALPLGAVGPSLARPYGLVLHGAEVTVPGRAPLSPRRAAPHAPGRPVRGRGRRLPGRRSRAGRRPGPADRGRAPRGRPRPVRAARCGRAAGRPGPVRPARRRAGRRRGEPPRAPQGLRHGDPRRRPAGAHPPGPARGDHGRGPGPGAARAAGPVHRRARSASSAGCPTTTCPPPTAAPTCSPWCAATGGSGWSRRASASSSSRRRPAASRRSPGAAAAPTRRWCDGATGLVVDPHDEVAVAGALARLLDDPDARRAMGEAGRARARDELSYDRLAEHLQHALESV